MLVARNRVQYSDVKWLFSWPRSSKVSLNKSIRKQSNAHNTNRLREMPDFSPPQRTPKVAETLFWLYNCMNIDRCIKKHSIIPLCSNPLNFDHLSTPLPSLKCESRKTNTRSVCFDSVASWPGVRTVTHHFLDQGWSMSLYCTSLN